MDDELASVASKEYDPNYLNIRNSGLNNSPSAIGSHLDAMPITLPAKRSVKEITTLDAIVGGRNQIYCEPHDVFDPNHPLRGKKRFNDNYRPIRSKINLKIAAQEVDTSSVKNRKSGKMNIK